MSKSGDGLLNWLMVIPVVVIGSILSAAYGAACMVIWAFKMAVRDPDQDSTT